MQLFVRAQELHSLEMTGQEAAAQIKAHVASLKGTAWEDQPVLLASTPLKDETTLGEYSVEALITLEVAIHMLRGKVHVSLAHSGKVRGQTLTVKEEEKKKKKMMTGRVKWWIQYNQRIVNVVPTFGKKKVPNPTLKSFVILDFSNKKAT
ncbi:ubiquitin-like FUBI-ribosomal protein eS30 fusion protein [Gorilla gorilla gorilla]|uniref:ubiquitin-like FUBI-ribosomal protein eS30 fusion protein n=1 Tax=Gorilla gorilla gorilla TaxID=9595 RepID=UPI00244635C1|nr:FAU ubiquitin-like and ribosomal protein S30 [Gorilla gorilla gorilla]